MKISRNPAKLHAPLAPYVHQIEVSGDNRWLNLSGQVGMNKSGEVPESGKEQLKLALENIRINLIAAKMAVDDLTKVVFYLVDPIDAKDRTEIIETFFGDNLSCTTLIYVKALAAPNIKVEIDAWACQEIKK